MAREWYAAGPLKIEQGFTVAGRRAGAGGSVSVVLGAAGSLHPVRSGSGMRFVTSSGEAALHYFEFSALILLRSPD